MVKRESRSGFGSAGARPSRLPGLLFTLFALFSIGAAAHELPEVPATSELPPPIERSDLDRLRIEVARLGRDELSALLVELEAADAETTDNTLRAILLRAGGSPPPGLPAARRARRETARLAALEFVRDALDAGGKPGLAFRTTLEEVLEGAGGSPVLWSAAARVAAETLQFDLAPTIAEGLVPERAPRERTAARRALHHLFLYWFEDLEAFEAVHDPDFEVERDDPFRRRLIEVSNRARKSEIRLLELDPARARAALADEDPAVRSAAARVTGGAITSGGVDAAASLDALLVRLETELDAEAWAAVSSALTEALASVPVETPALMRMRGIVLARAASRDDLCAPVARTLARLPWSTDADALDHGVLRGIERLSSLFEERALRADIRDEDELLDLLQSLERLCALADGAELDLTDETRGVRDPLKRLAADGLVSEDVRSGAAATLARVALAEDVPMLVSVLKAPTSSTTLRYTLLGALQNLGRDLGSESPTGTVVLDALLSHTLNDEVDLRVRALNALLDPTLEDLVRQARPGLWIQRLETEDQPALQSGFLQLLQRFGRPDMLQRLLDSPAFPRVAAGEPRRVLELTGVLRAWTKENPEGAMKSALQLWNTETPDEPRRLQQALSILANLDAPLARRLPADDHCTVVSWAHELHRSKSLLVELRTASNTSFLQRVAEVHLDLCAKHDESVAQSLAHVRAVLLGDLLELDQTATSADDIFAAYQIALDWDAEANASANEPRIRCDRARFALTRGRDDLALEDYRVVLELESRAGGLRPVLETRDLRHAGELAERRAAEPATRAGDAFDWSQALLAHPSWTEESEEGRIADLRNWIRRALASQDPTRIALARASLDTLPAEWPEDESKLPPRWRGLSRHAQDLRDRARELAPPEPPEEPETPDPAPEDPADGEGAREP